MSRRTSRTLSVREVCRLRAVVAVLLAPVAMAVGIGWGGEVGLAIAGVGLLVGIITLRLAHRSRWWTA